MGKTHTTLFLSQFFGEERNTKKSLEHRLCCNFDDNLNGYIYGEEYDEEKKYLLDQGEKLLEASNAVHKATHKHQNEHAVTVAQENGLNLPPSATIEEVEEASFPDKLKKIIKEYRKHGQLQNKLPHLKKHYPNYAQQLDSLATKSIPETTKQAIKKRAEQNNAVAGSLKEVFFQSPTIEIGDITGTGDIHGEYTKEDLDWDKERAISALQRVLSYLPKSAFHTVIPNGTIRKDILVYTMKHPRNGYDYYESAFQAISTQVKLTEKEYETLLNFYNNDVDRNGIISKAFVDKKIGPFGIFGTERTYLKDYSELDTNNVNPKLRQEISTLPKNADKKMVQQKLKEWSQKYTTPEDKRFLSQLSGTKEFSILYDEGYHEESKGFVDFVKANSLGGLSPSETKLLWERIKQIGQNEIDKEREKLMEGYEEGDLDAPFIRRYSRAETVEKGLFKTSEFLQSHHDNNHVSRADVMYRIAKLASGDTSVSLTITDSFKRIPELRNLSGAEKDFVASSHFAKWFQNGVGTVQDLGSLNLVLENSLVKNVTPPRDTKEETIVNVITDISVSDWENVGDAELHSTITQFNDTEDVKISETNNGKTITTVWKDGTETTTEVYKQGQERDITTTTKTTKEIKQTKYIEKRPKFRIKAYYSNSVQLGKNTKLGYSVNLGNVRDIQASLSHRFDSGTGISANSQGGFSLDQVFQHSDGSSTRIGYNTMMLSRNYKDVKDVFSLNHIQKMDGMELDAGVSFTEEQLTRIRMVLREDLSSPNSPTMKEFKTVYQGFLQQPDLLLQQWQSSFGERLTSLSPSQEKTAAYQLAAAAMAEKVCGRIFGVGFEVSPLSFGPIFEMIVGMKTIREAVALPITAGEFINDLYRAEASAGRLSDNIRLNARFRSQDFQRQDGMHRVVPNLVAENMKSHQLKESVVYVAAGDTDTQVENGSGVIRNFPQKPPSMSWLTTYNGESAVLVGFDHHSPQPSLSGAINKSEYLQKYKLTINPHTGQETYTFLGNEKTQKVTNTSQISALHEERTEKEQIVRYEKVLNGYKKVTRRGERVVTSTRTEKGVEKINPDAVQQVETLRDQILEKLRDKNNDKAEYNKIKEFEVKFLSNFERGKNIKAFEKVVREFEQTFKVTTILEPELIAQALFRARMAKYPGNPKQRINYAKNSSFAKDTKAIFGDAIDSLGTGSGTHTMNVNSFAMVNRFDRLNGKEVGSTDAAYKADGMTIVQMKREKRTIIDPRTKEQIECYVVTGLLDECKNGFIGAEPITEQEFQHQEKVPTSETDKVPQYRNQPITRTTETSEYYSSMVSADQLTYSRYINKFKTIGFSLSATIGMPSFQEVVSTSTEVMEKTEKNTEKRNTKYEKSSTEDVTYKTAEPATPNPKQPKKPAPDVTDPIYAEPTPSVVPGGVTNPPVVQNPAAKNATKNNKNFTQKDGQLFLDGDPIGPGPAQIGSGYGGHSEDALTGTEYAQGNGPAAQLPQPTSSELPTEQATPAPPIYTVSTAPSPSTPNTPQTVPGVVELPPQQTVAVEMPDKSTQSFTVADLQRYADNGSGAAQNALNNLTQAMAQEIESPSQSA